MWQHPLRIRRALVVAATVVLASTAPAFAGPTTYTVTAGSALAGTPVPFTADTTGTTPQVTFEDVDASFGMGLTLNCASGTIAGTITTGTNRPPNLTGPLTLFWSTCSVPPSHAFTVSGSATLDARGSTLSGVTRAALSDMTVHMSWTYCSFDLTGEVEGSYDNATTALTFFASQTDLVASNLTGPGCALLGIGNGDEWSYEAGYDLSADNPTYDPIQISS